jgi:hypothetical protein
MPVTDDLVFLSYAREDVDAASGLYTELVTAGIKVWFDQEDIAPGAKWKPAIRSAIRKCRYFIALMSSRSVSKKGFVNRELRQAIEILDEFPENTSYLIPVRLDDCEAPHDTLKELQWVDLFPAREKGVSKLLRFFGVIDAASKIQIDEQMELIKQTGRPTTGVQVNGIYQSKQIDSYYKYVRFYTDGLVLAVSSTGSPTQIIRWFNREEFAERSYHSSGTYTVSGSNIEFSTTSSSGTVDYEGEIQGDSLILKTYSHINEHRGIHEYKFIQIDDPVHSKT